MSVEHNDVLLPWRHADRRATLIAVIAVASALAAMLIAATLPLWAGKDPIRTVLLAAYNQNQLDWIWEFSPRDAWWAVGLVFVVPVLSTVVGAYRSRRRLADATRRMPGTAGLSTIGPALSEGQRNAQVRSREVDLAARQRRFTEQNRSRLSPWSSLGAAFTYILGGWFLIGIALDVTGATATPVGLWIAAQSWWLLIAAPIVWGAILNLTDRRRGSLAR